MSIYKWIGGTSTNPATSTNYSPNGNPTTGDTLIFDGDATGDCAGADLSAATLAELHIRKSFTKSLGSTATAFKIGATLVFIGQNLEPSQTPSGPTRVVLDLAAAQSTVVIYGTGAGTPDTGLENIRIKGSHASNSLYMLGGTAAVGIGTNSVSDTATFATITVNGGRLNVGSGVTWTTMAVGGQGIVTTFAGGSGTTLTLDGSAQVESQGNYLIATVTVNGGTFKASHRKSSGASITTLTRSGSNATVDFSADPRSVTVTTFNEGDGTLKVFNNSQVTFTTTVQSNGTKNTRTVSLS